MSEREMIEQACQAHGLAINGWDEEHENGLTAKLGAYKVVVEYEDDGLYEGEEGELTACVVGAAHYGNQHVSFSFTGEDMDIGNHVRDLYALEAIDD